MSCSLRLEFLTSMSLCFTICHTSARVLFCFACVTRLIINHQSMYAWLLHRANCSHLFVCFQIAFTESTLSRVYLLRTPTAVRAQAEIGGLSSLSILRECPAGVVPPKHAPVPCLDIPACPDVATASDFTVIASPNNPSSVGKTEVIAITNNARAKKKKDDDLVNCQS